MSPPPTSSPATGEKPASSDATRVIQGDSSPQSDSRDDHEVRVVGFELHVIVVIDATVIGTTTIGDGAAGHHSDERELCPGRGACLTHRLHHTHVGPTVDHVDRQLLAEWHDDGFEQLFRGVERSSAELLGTADDDEYRARSRHFELAERGR